MPKGVCNIRPSGSNNCWPTTTIASPILGVGDCAPCTTQAGGPGEIYDWLNGFHRNGSGPNLCISATPAPLANPTCHMGMPYKKPTEWATLAALLPPPSPPSGSGTGLSLTDNKL